MALAARATLNVVMASIAKFELSRDPREGRKHARCRPGLEPGPIRRGLSVKMLALDSFYDNNGKVVWVSDAYVERALLPQTAAPFSVEIPKTLGAQVHDFHVVVNQYSVGRY